MTFCHITLFPGRWSVASTERNSYWFSYSVAHTHTIGSASRALSLGYGYVSRCGHRLNTYLGRST